MILRGICQVPVYLKLHQIPVEGRRRGKKRELGIGVDRGKGKLEYWEGGNRWKKS